MNRLFNSLRGLRQKAEPVAPRTIEPSIPAEPALPGFEGRAETLQRYTEQAAAYESDLQGHLATAQANLDRFMARVEAALDAGQDRDAYEFLRMAARIRPQVTLLQREIASFHAVAGELGRRVSLLIENLDEARALAEDGQQNPAATAALDRALTSLTRYFVMLDRVAQARRRELPERLAAMMLEVIDDRALDLELAQYVMQRRRQLGAG
jgi:phage shock protein A